MGLFSFFFIQTFWHASGLLMHSSLKVWVSLLINFLWKILHSLVLTCCRLLKMISKSATAVLKITSPKPKLKIPDQKTTLNQTKPNQNPTSLLSAFLYSFPKDSELVLRPCTANWHLTHSTGTVSSYSKAIFWRVPGEWFKGSELAVFYLLTNDVMSHVKSVRLDGFWSSPDSSCLVQKELKGSKKETFIIHQQ